MKRFTALTVVALLIGCLSLGSCNKGPKDMSVQALQELSEIGTVEYEVSKVVKATDNKNYRAVFGARKIIFNTHCTLKAGFDMSKMTENDIKVDKKTKSISITLPAPQLLSFNMKPDDIHMAYAESTGLRGDFSAEERNELLIQGENDIRSSVEGLGIYDDAKKFASDYFESMLKMAGYEKVTINFKENMEGGNV